jgi:hypothetical protein
MGTTLVDGMCVGGSGATCGSGTTLVNGVCVGDGGGTTTCGPGTVMQGDECVVDATAPGPVTGLTATAGATSVDLSWTPGLDSTETLVARLVAGAYDTPAPLTSYTVGQMLPGGATVIAAGAMTSVTDTAATPGRYTYLAWSRNASGKYGFPRVVSTFVDPPGLLLGGISVDVANATATVMSPDNFVFDATNVVFDAASGTVTFDLSVTQNTAGHLFNLKAIINPVTVGAVANPTGIADGEPFFTFRLGAVVPGGPLTTSVAISGVTATDTIGMQVRIVESPLGIVGSNAIDIDGGPSFAMQLPALRGVRNNDSVFTSGHFDASGRYFYGLTRWSPSLFRLDTATGDVTAVTPYSTASGNGTCLVFGDDGYAYAVMGLGSHRGSSNSYGVALAKVDPVTMTTVATATLTAEVADTARGCALHGTTLALGFGQGVYFADISEMTFTDTDASSADVIDPVPVTATNGVHELAFSPDGATLYVTERRASQIYSIDPTTFATASYHTAGGNVVGLTVDATGALWWGQTTGLFSFDGTTETQVPNYTGQVDAIGPRYGNLLPVADRDTGTAFVINVTDGTVTRQASLNNNRMGHSYNVFPSTLP